MNPLVIIIILLITIFLFWTFLEWKRFSKEESLQKANKAASIASNAKVKSFGTESVDTVLAHQLTTAEEAVKWFLSRMSGARASYQVRSLMPLVLQQLEAYASTQPPKLIYKTFNGSNKVGTKAYVYSRGDYEFFIQYDYVYMETRVLSLYRDPELDLAPYAEKINLAKGTIDPEEGTMCVPIIQNILIIYPTDSNSDIKISVVSQALNGNRVLIEYPTEPQKIIQLSHSEKGDLYTRIFAIPEDWNLPNEYLNLAYPAIRCSHNGTTKIMANGQAAAGLLTATLQAGFSVAIGHVPGTGKTFLANHICQGLTYKPDTEVYLCAAETLLATATDAWLHHSWPKNSIILVDQAEELLRGKDPRSRPVLDLVAGTGNRLLKQQFIFIFNGQREEMDPAWLGHLRNRLIYFEIPLLTTVQAEKLIQYWKLNPPEGVTFDFKEFKSLAAKAVEIPLSGLWGLGISADYAQAQENSQLEAYSPPFRPKKPRKN